jgi:hypothetical protein
VRHVLQICGPLAVAVAIVMTSTPASAAATAPTTTLPAGPTTTTTTSTIAAPPTPDSPGLFDFAGRVRQAVNDWFRDLVSSALTPTLDLLGRTVLATPDVTAPGGRARELWWISAGIANAVFVLLVVVGGLLLIGHETVQTSYGIKEIAPRLVLGFVAANLSLVLAGRGIGLANALSRALAGQGVDPAHVTDQLKRLALAPLDGNSIFLILAAGLIAALALMIVAAYVIRVATVIVLVAAAPLALICHALPQTEGVARAWWRAFAACLGVQVGQAFLLVAALRTFFAADRASVFGLNGSGQLVDLVVAACLLWMLARLPVWASRAVLPTRSSMLVRLAKSYVLYRVIRRVAK